MNPKLIILAAGYANTTLGSENTLPRCLTELGDGSLGLDRIIESATRFGISKIALVAGRNIIEVMDKYPQLDYFYVKDAKHKGNLHSLLSAKSMLSDDVFVSYGDVLFNESVLKNLAAVSGYVNISYDSGWKERYLGRKIELLREAEKVYVSDHTHIITRDEMRSMQLLG